MIEKHLERVPTMFRDADDQHVVIIAQKVAARERRESGGSLDVRAADLRKRWRDNASPFRRLRRSRR
jgi:hypothetical protein